jgi:putative ABC transport system permease protein
MWRDPIGEELKYHFEALKRERIEAGDSEAEAARFARLKLGQVALVEEEVRRMSWTHRLEMIGRDARFAIRSFKRHGGAYLGATAILAIGIGLSVAMFSLVEAVLLNPLPFPDQRDIHMIWKTDLQAHDQLVGELAFTELADFQANIPNLEYVALIPAALYGNGRVLQAGKQDPVQIEACPTSAGLFKVLKVAPVLGRDFETADEDPGAAPVVILSDRIWHEQFGSKREAVGQIVRLNGVGHTIIGVMAATVDFPRGAGLWIPLKTDLRRGATWLIAIARMRAGTSHESLQQAADRTFRLQASAYPKDYTPTQRAIVTPIAEYLTGTSKPQLLVSLLASLLLLVSACVSASNLFLSRTLVRRREVATRVSLGASRGQILAQFATEAAVASAMATTIGSLLASVLIRLLVSWAPPDIPRIDAARLDPGALAFAAGVTLLAAFACVIGPALILENKNLDAMLREGVRTAGSRTGQRLQSVFIFAQSALTVAILALGLMLFLSYRAMLNTDLGFIHRDTLTMNLAMRGPQADPAVRRRFYTELLDRLRAAPEVTSAAAVLLRPFEGPIGWDTEYVLEFEAATRDPNKLTKANFEVITPRYFETVGTAFMAGRDFNDHDTPTSEKVAIINESMARQIRSAGREPILHRIQAFGAWRTIIGVTADARYRRVVQSADNVYVPYTQSAVPTNYLVLRGPVSSSELLSLVRKTLKEVDPSQAIAGEATLGQMIERNTARNRFNVSILILFAFGAIVLAAAGIHSVVRESVTVRAKEIALRIALGAGRAHLVTRTTRSALLSVASGELAGVAGALVLGNAAVDLLYGISPSDPSVLIAVAAFMFAVAAVSSAIPAWIAAGQDPRECLQSD